MIVGLVLFTVLGMAFGLVGFLMVTNHRNFGVRFVETFVWKPFRMGSVDTHRQILGWGYLVVGTVFAGAGIVVLLHNAIR